MPGATPSETDRSTPARLSPVTLFGIVADRDRAAIALRLGVDYVEPTIAGNVVTRDADGVWQLDPAFAGGEFPSFAILFPGEIALSDPRFPDAEVTAYLERVLGLVGSIAATGAKVVFGSGAARALPPGIDRAAGEACFARTLVEARDVAARNDLRIMLEPLHRGETDVVNSIAEAIAFLDEHRIDGVPIVADLFHIQTEAESLDFVAQNVGRIGHAHIADTGRRFLGSGDWPWREFLRVLRDGGYDSSVSIECAWGDDFEAELAASLASLRAS